MCQRQIDLTREQRPRAQTPRQTFGQAGARRAGFRRRRDHDDGRPIPNRAACFGQFDPSVARRMNIARSPLRWSDHQCRHEQNRKRSSNEVDGPHCSWLSSARYLRAKRNASSTSTLPGVLSRAVTVTDVARAPSSRSIPASHGAQLLYGTSENVSCRSPSDNGTMRAALMPDATERCVDRCAHFAGRD